MNTSWRLSSTCTKALRASQPRRTICPTQFRLQLRRQFAFSPRRLAQKEANEPVNPADDPNWVSLADKPSPLVRHKSRHGWGIYFMALIPLTAFALGTWQIERLKWKTALMSRFEHRLLRPPLPLPPRLDASAVPDFDYRRVLVTGRFRHDQEVLVGPRVMDGENGYKVVTPLEREGGDTVLVCRGWIPKRLADQRLRREGLPTGEVTVEGLLREAPRKNLFTPENAPEKNEFYFPDVPQIAKLTGAKPIWIEETWDMELFDSIRRKEKGIPMGRPAEVHLFNNHGQYIVTWYTLAFATSIMFVMLLRRKHTAVRRSTQW